MTLNTRKRTPIRLVGMLASAAAILFLPPLLWAADTTPPTTPAITDDGTYTVDPTSLHATWMSSDPESSVVEYQYLIRQTSTSGTIIVNWTSTGSTPSATATGLSLLQGTLYYFQVKARNGAGLWSAVGSSNGIKVDTTPPSVPPQPTEGSTVDLDFNASGAYYIYWYGIPLSADAESGVAAYELQERVGSAGAWTTIVASTTSRYAYVSGRIHNTQYVYRVRAKNGAGLFSDWSQSSDGVLIDKTAPAQIAAVTDDGVMTTSTTQLHATWTTTTDPESGVMDYQYLIRQDSTSGTVIVPYTSVGLATEVTRTGLTLLPGKLYFIGVIAKNGAGLASAIRYSDSIRTPDPTPPAAPGQPLEGSSNATVDVDYDADGSYYVSWPAAADPDSGIAGYEVQERAEIAGAWISVATTNASTRYLSRSGRVDQTTYFYQVRAQNNSGLWGPFSTVSDGMLIDKTAPVTIATVTDDGATTTSTTQLHAVWTATTDPESGVVAYEYLIRQDSTSGVVVINYTPVGLATEVTQTGLSLVQGKLYYFGVRAKNGAGLYSILKYSDGIRVPDPTPPGAPGQPQEGSSNATVDYDYDSDGVYYVSWTAATDADSGIAAYEVQERVGVAGFWTTIGTPTAATRYVSVSGRVDKSAYFYQVRAKNNSDLWGPFSPVSDGILIDKTAPTSPATVTDDGATTFLTTQLHATWTASSDPESGIMQYEYLIRQDSTSGTIMVPYTSVGTATEVTRTGLSLTVGKTYYIGVRAKNGASLYSSTRYSNGILVQADTDPPAGTVSINTGAAYTKLPTVTLTLSAMDNSGIVSQMQFSDDNITYTPAEPYATTKPWTLPSGDGPKTVYVKFSDPSNNWSNPASDSITLDTTVPSGAITSPSDGAVVGAQ